MTTVAVIYRGAAAYPAGVMTIARPQPGSGARPGEGSAEGQRPFCPRRAWPVGRCLKEHVSKLDNVPDAPSPTRRECKAGGAV